jgi:myo-inositol-1(or 4)-monophosphatase
VLRCYVACGRVDAFWEHQLNPWDLAAGALIVREAGGQVSGVDGSVFSLDSGHVLASNGLVHGQMQNYLAGIQ